jgi:hypothetical protein
MDMDMDMGMGCKGRIAGIAVTILLWASTSFAMDPQEWKDVSQSDFWPYGSIAIDCALHDHSSKSKTGILSDFLRVGRTRVERETMLNLNGHQTQVSVSIYLRQSPADSIASGRPQALIKLRFSSKTPRPFEWTLSNYGSVDNMMRGVELGKDVSIEGALGFYLIADLSFLQSTLACSTTPDVATSYSPEP